MTTKDATHIHEPTKSAYTDAQYKRDTQQHIDLVARFLQQITTELTARGAAHDASKFHEPERSIFRDGTHRRNSVAYGGQAYREHMKSVGVALDHHYANNRHHPEYHEQGIQDMNLIDIVEMLCDWMSASMRDAKGDAEEAHRVIAINQKRFGYSNELRSILHNTVGYLLDGQEGSP